MPMIGSLAATPRNMGSQLCRNGALTIGQRRRLVLDQRVSDRTVEGVAGVTPPLKTRGV